MVRIVLAAAAAIALAWSTPAVACQGCRERAAQKNEVPAAESAKKAAGESAAHACGACGAEGKECSECKCGGHSQAAHDCAGKAQKKQDTTKS